MRFVFGRIGRSGAVPGPRGLALAGAAGFVLVPLAAIAADRRGMELGVWRFLLLSIAFFAFAYGLRGGLAAAAGAVLLSTAWERAFSVDSVDGAVLLLRSLNYVLAGAIVGWLVDSRASAMGALARHVALSSDVIVSGTDGHLREVNPAFTRILGHPVEDVVGKPYLDFVHPEDRGKSVSVEREVVGGYGPITRFENRYRHRDGTYRWLEWSINIDPRLEEGFAVGRDVTERKLAEEREQQMLTDLRRALAAREEALQQRLVTVIESVQDGLIEIDAAGLVLMFNKAAEEMFGYGRDEVIGRDVKTLIADHQREARGDDLPHVGEADGTRLNGLGREVEGRRKDGSVFPLDLAMTETTVDGETVFVGILRDITERRQAEAQERHYRQTLEWAVRDRTRELQEQTHALEEARLDTLQRLAMAGEYHDEDTYLHTERVGGIAAQIAHAYGCPPSFVDLIRLAAPLHDLGKLALSDRILLKKGPLTAQQWEQVKTHPAVGAAILAGSNSEVLQLAEEIALTHHEWWDGNGYPRSLRGAGIPLSGRIVTLADTYDALTHDRPYKPAWPIDKAYREIQRLAGTRFDPEIVSAFMLLDPNELTRGEVAPALHLRRTRPPELDARIASLGTVA